MNFLWSQVNENPFDFLKTFTKLLTWINEKLFSCGICNKILELIQEANVIEFPMISSQGKSFWISKDFHKAACMKTWKSLRYRDCGIVEWNPVPFPIPSRTRIPSRYRFLRDTGWGLVQRNLNETEIAENLTKKQHCWWPTRPFRS